MRVLLVMSWMLLLLVRRKLVLGDGQWLVLHDGIADVVELLPLLLGLVDLGQLFLLEGLLDFHHLLDDVDVLSRSFLSMHFLDMNANVVDFV